MPYPKSHEINWNDEAVWKDMLRSPIGIFQFESAFAFDSLKRFKPQSVFDMSLVTACIRPSGASYRDELLDRKPHTNPSPIIDELLKDNLGYLIYQEDTIKFLQLICGLSGSEADNIRRAIGRKQKERLDAALPSIFEGYCSKSPQPRQIAETEAKEFLQIIEDSASYQFGYNHSVGYCMIGYLCAYLRYYHPQEFITAYLNNADTDTDVKNGSELAQLYKLRILPPRFGRSKDKYVYDRTEGHIYKGIGSVKYLNSAVSDELYELAETLQPESFMELLWGAEVLTSIDTRQREILIKLDFFDTFGNARELLRIVDFFEFFKCGSSKKISKDKVQNETMAEVISRHATDIQKSGGIAKSYTITDMFGLLHDCEALVKSLGITDFDIKMKMGFQEEFLGYIDLTTNKEADRRKLIITNVYPLKSKTNGETWGYTILTRSIGSGKTSRLTVRSKLYDKQPLKKMDVIYAHDVRQDKKGYWSLLAYDRIA